jgi:hypothetical protein
MPRWPSFAVSLLLTFVACSDPTAPEPAGRWGGPDVSLLLAKSGGTLTYTCGAGTVDSGWTVRAAGRFSGAGQHFFGGGPVPPQGHPPHPAVYAGRLTGDQLVLTVTLTDLQQVLGPFTLRRGGPPVAELCV